VSRALESLSSRRRVPEGVEVVRLGPISLRVHRPATQSNPAPALLWIHGGGYVLGTPAQDDYLCRMVADQVGAVVVAPQYRKAPEHPFPVPLDDCYEALQWLAARGDVDPGAIAVGGASAGGGLAAALALLARDRGEISPVFQLLSYPMLDDRTATRTDLDERNARLWNNKSNRFGWTAYLGRGPGEPGTSSLAAPARSENLAGLPPAWIGVGTCDIFYGEDILYAERLREAAVACEVHTVQGAFHGFDSILPKASVTQQFRAAQLAALTGVLRPDR
jgi:acetyl esterase/lipase